MDVITYLQSTTFYGNTLWQLAMAIIGAVVVYAVLQIFQIVVLKRLESLSKKTKTDIDDILVDCVSSLRPPLYLFIALFVGYRFLSFSDRVGSIVMIVFIAIIAVELLIVLNRLGNKLIERKVRRAEDMREKTQTRAMLRLMKSLVMAALWVVVALLILSNYGVDVTSFVASLGIGGIAVALALQNVLGDMFSAFTIYIDKPFQPGDFIVVGTEKGTVERVGMKSTRIRSLQGEEIVISNNELTSARIQNFKKMEKRRIVFQLGVAYGTPNKKLEKIPGIVQKIIEETPDIEFSRCHFATFGDFSLNYETVYFVTTGDYEKYMDAQQRLNLEIYEAFAKEGIEFAYPTQEVILRK